MMNLGLLQIADSALPISGYTHSWGLEAAIAQGTIRDPESLERWTSRWLQTTLGPLEGVLVAASCRAAQDGDADALRHYNGMLDASVVPPSIQRASLEMGEQLMALGATWSWSADRLHALVGSVSPAPAPGWHHAIAFGILGAIADSPPREVLAAFLHQAALGVIGAGVRAVPVGHTHGQQVLAYLHAEIRDLVDRFHDSPPETAGAGCPSYEILCDEQTKLYARMFRS